MKNANLTPMQTTDHPYFELDTSNPLHAKAYLLAVSHFLSGWPQDWSAERLALALVDEENPDQKKVNVWDAVKHYAADIDSDPYLQADSLACDLAENFITFAQETYGQALEKAVSRFGCGCGQSGLCKKCCDVDLEIHNLIKP